MAYEERNISNSISSDANFRTWGSTISDLWQDVGLTKTADTGQIDWTTATRSANNFSGYEIFTLDTDTEQSTFGLYIRVDYGCGSTTSLQSLKIQVGESTDGAGTLTGQVGTARTFSASGTANTATFPHFCSAGDGYFAYAGGWSSGGVTTTYLQNQIFIIERLRDNTGAPTDEGIYTFFAGPFGGGGGNASTQILRSDDTVTAYSSAGTLVRLGAYVPNLTGNRGTDLYLYTHQPADYAIYNPCLSNLFYYHTDLANGVNISVDMYGTSRTFKPLGNNFAGTSNWQNVAFGHTNSGLALRWE